MERVIYRLVVAASLSLILASTNSLVCGALPSDATQRTLAVINRSQLAMSCQAYHGVQALMPAKLTRDTVVFHIKVPSSYWVLVRIGDTTHRMLIPLCSSSGPSDTFCLVVDSMGSLNGIDAYTDSQTLLFTLQGEEIL